MQEPAPGREQGWYGDCLGGPHACAPVPHGVSGDSSLPGQMSGVWAGFREVMLQLLVSRTIQKWKQGQVR